MLGNSTAPNLTGGRALEPEQYLWIAVLARAVHDAFAAVSYTHLTLPTILRV